MPRTIPPNLPAALAIFLCGTVSVLPADVSSVRVASLPPGVEAVWAVEKAFSECGLTRERVSLNGLWEWQPADAGADRVPDTGWGWFKVPGCWPGITDYMQKDSQTVYPHPNWREQRLGSVTAAWHQREVTVPKDWEGRRISLSVAYLNSYATVYVDGKRVGEIHFPGGDLDITSYCRAGSTHRLSLLVLALPLKGVMLAYTDSASAREVEGTVARRGLCGDVWLTGVPSGPRVADVRVTPSVRRRGITVDAAIQGLSANRGYTLRARVTERESGRVANEFRSPAFAPTDLKEGRVVFTQSWTDPKLWDLHTPYHQYRLELTLLNEANAVLDVGWIQGFGFREFWIDGRDFYLNGTRLLLSAVPLDNAQVGAALATYAAARESLERLRSFGINFVYTHNYGCEPGAHLGFDEILRAADDVGMLVGFSQPHFSAYDWRAPDADEANGYARHAAFYVRAARNHPSVVLYAMSHNATGYSEDMDPDRIDGVQDARDAWALRNAESAQRAEAIVRRLDPDRIVYHHASGNLGSMHPINFYPNFVPIQELSDWFEHWATEGIKPVFLCEYGAPFSWDWTMYRGWYQGKREFGSARVPWEFCLAEWNAQFLGDRAYPASEAEQTNLRWEAKQFRAGRLWHRWDYPHPVGSTRFDERYPVFAAYLTDNWRAFRTWGVSALSPWEHGHFWQLRDGVNKRRTDLDVDWDNLQRPGFSPDYIDQRYERMDLAFERADWIATPAAKALLRNNRPLLAYIAGKRGAFTSKDHNFRPGETVEKQLIFLNNSRETVSGDATWSFALPQVVDGRARVSVLAGQQERIVMRFELPPDLAPGRYDLKAVFRFSTGEIQQDSFAVDVLPPPPALSWSANIAVFDPQGQTAAWLSLAGIPCQAVDVGVDLSAYDILVVGKSALTPRGGAPNVHAVRDGLKVLVFEQTSEVLEKRFGFRVAEYGLRQVFPRVPDHPVLAGIQAEQLRDWRGSATLLPSRLSYRLRPRHGPTVEWCGLPVSRLWRCGHRGSVASVLIEKPACGDFLPVLDGGYGLQYSPLLEYREGKGMMLFCQMDVTGRTAIDPAAEALTRNLFDYVASWQSRPRRQVVYVGDPAGEHHLAAAGFPVVPFGDGSLTSDQVLVVGRGGGSKLSEQGEGVAQWLDAGGYFLGIGLDQDDLDATLPFPVSVTQVEHISTWFAPFGSDSRLAGVGPADVHNRDPREIPLLSTGVRLFGNGVLADVHGANVVFCQLAPWDFDAAKPMNQKRTFRRVAFLLTRLLGNLGVAGSTPLLDRFHRPVEGDPLEKRWLDGLYLDQPEEWDDPYRFFRW